MDNLFERLFGGGKPSTPPVEGDPTPRDIIPGLGPAPGDLIRKPGVVPPEGWWLRAPGPDGTDVFYWPHPTRPLSRVEEDWIKESGNIQQDMELGAIEAERAEAGAHRRTREAFGNPRGPRYAGPPARGKQEL